MRDTYNNFVPYLHIFVQWIIDYGIWLNFSKDLTMKTASSSCADHCLNIDNNVRSINESTYFTPIKCWWWPIAMGIYSWRGKRGRYQEIFKTKEHCYNPTWQLTWQLMCIKTSNRIDMNVLCVHKIFCSPASYCVSKLCLGGMYFLRYGSIPWSRLFFYSLNKSPM